MIEALRQFWNDYKKFIFILLLIVLIPVGLNIIFIYVDFTTGKDLGNVAWLAFWGSYLGGAATLIAVYLTLSQNMKVINQNEKIFTQNQENMKFQEERTRIALMPYIEVMLFPDENLNLHKTKLYPPNGFIILTNDPNEKKFRSDLPKEYQQLIESPLGREPDGSPSFGETNAKFVRLIMTQKAPSLARNIQLSVCLVVEQEEEIRTYIKPAFVLAVRDSVTIPIFFDEDWPEGEYKFIVSFEDIEGRGYEQFFIIHHKGSLDNGFIPMSNPKLQKK